MLPQSCEWPKKCVNRTDIHKKKSNQKRIKLHECELRSEHVKLWWYVKQKPEHKQFFFSPGYYRRVYMHILYVPLVSDVFTPKLFVAKAFLPYCFYSMLCFSCDFYIFPVFMRKQHQKFFILLKSIDPRTFGIPEFVLWVLNWYRTDVLLCLFPPKYIETVLMGLRVPTV